MLEFLSKPVLVEIAPGDATPRTGRRRSCGGMTWQRANRGWDPTSLARGADRGLGDQHRGMSAHLIALASPRSIKGAAVVNQLRGTSAVLEAEFDAAETSHCSAWRIDRACRVGLCSQLHSTALNPFEHLATPTRCRLAQVCRFRRPSPSRAAYEIVPLSPSRVIAAGDAPNAGERMSAIGSRWIAALGLLATGLTGCITAAEQATPIRPITCTAGADCDTKWSRAASWIALNPTWKIKTRTDQFIELRDNQGCNHARKLRDHFRGLLR
jgi:hypothetical protein